MPQHIRSRLRIDVGVCHVDVKTLLLKSVALPSDCDSCDLNRRSCGVLAAQKGADGRCLPLTRFQVGGASSIRECRVKTRKYRQILQQRKYGCLEKEDVGAQQDERPNNDRDVLAAIESLNTFQAEIRQSRGVGYASDVNECAKREHVGMEECNII